jgi:hypothetical protein
MKVNISQEIADATTAIKKELASTIKASLLQLEGELTPSFLASKLLLNRTNPVLQKEIQKFQNAFKSRIKFDKIDSELDKGISEIADKVIHNIFKRHLTEFAERVETRMRLLGVLMQYGEKE